MDVERNDFLYDRCRCPDPPIEINRHDAHALWELFFVVNGSMRLMVEGRKYAVQTDSLCVIRPAQVHCIHSIGSTSPEYISILCDIDRLMPEFKRKLQKEITVLNFANDSDVCNMIHDIDKSFSTGGRESSETIKKLLKNDLLPYIIQASYRQEIQKPQAYDMLFQSAIRYIEENITTLNRVQELCEILGFSKNRLYDLFIQYMLFSPKKYMQLKRLAMAKIAVMDGEDVKTARRKYRIKEDAAL